MRGVFTRAALAAAALAIATPASAATIIQFRSLSGVQPFEGFSSSLGALNSVTLEVAATTYRQWFVSTPAGSPPNTVTWSIDSYYNVRGTRGSTPLAGFPLRVETQGGGSVALNNGVFAVSATGAGSFDLDPSLFVDVPPFTFFTISDPGLSVASESGTTAISSVPATLFQTLGDCGFGVLSTQCGLGGATLTYEFTPISGAVPEPATWAMMILGFGAIGSALRRARKVQAAVSFA